MDRVEHTKCNEPHPRKNNFRRTNPVDT
jgi:hypothetical protein